MAGGTLRLEYHPEAAIEPQAEDEHTVAVRFAYVFPGPEDATTIWTITPNGDALNVSGSHQLGRTESTSRAP